MVRQRVCVALAAMFIGLATTARGDDGLLKMVPADALGFGVVHRLGETDAKTQKILKALQAPTTSLLDKIKSDLGFQKGLDKKGDMAVIFMPGSDPNAGPAIVTIMPVTEYAKFVSQFRPEKVGEKLTEFEFKGTKLVVANRGSYALVAPSQDKKALQKVLEAKEAVAAGLAGLETWLGQQDAYFVATSAGIKLVSTKAIQPIKEPRHMDGGLDMQSGMEVVAAIPPRTMPATYRTIIADVEKEVRLVAIGIRVAQGTIHVGVRARTTPGGAASKFLAGLKPAEGDRLVGLTGGPFIVAGGGIVPELLVERMADIAAGIVKEDPKAYGSTPQQADEWGKVAAQPYSGVRSAAVVIKAGRRSEPLYSNIISAMRVDDGDRYMEKYLKVIATYNEAVKEAKDSALKPIVAKKTKLDGKPAMEFEMTIPMPKSDGVMPGQETMIDQLVGPGGRVTVYMASLDKHTVLLGYGMTKEAMLKAVREAKDPKAAFSAEADVAKMAAMLPPGAHWIGYVEPRGFTAFVMRNTIISLAQLIPEVASKPSSEFSIPPFPRTPPVGFTISGLSGEIQGEALLPAAVLDAICEYRAMLSEKNKPVP